MKEFLMNLGLSGPFNETERGVIVLDLKDSNDFSRVYSLLDNSPEVEEDSTSSSVNEHFGNVQFYNDENRYLLTLVSDFDNDTYSLTCKKVGF